MNLLHSVARGVQAMWKIELWEVWRFAEGLTRGVGDQRWFDQFKFGEESAGDDIIHSPASSKNQSPMQMGWLNRREIPQLIDRMPTKLQRNCIRDNEGSGWLMVRLFKHNQYIQKRGN